MLLKSSNNGYKKNVVEFKSLWFLVSQDSVGCFWVITEGHQQGTGNFLPNYIRNIEHAIETINNHQSIDKNSYTLKLTKISHFTRTSINQPTFKCLGKKTCNYCKPNNPIMCTHKGPHLWSGLGGIKVLEHYYVIWRLSKLTVSCILTSKGYNSRLACFSRVLVAAPRDL